MFNRANKFLLMTDNINEGVFITNRSFSKKGETNENKKKLPDIITGQYKEDYDILYLDRIITEKLRREKKEKIPGLKKKLREKKALSKTTQVYLARQKTLDEIDSLKKEIHHIEKDIKINFYQKSVEQLIEDYKKLRKNVKTVQFGETEVEDDTELDTLSKKRLAIIDEYIEIAKNYIEINLIRDINIQNNELCINCNYKLNRDFSTDEGTIRCPKCNAEHNVVILTKSAKDGQRINNNNSSEDESIENFLRAFYRYQGIQQEKPDPIVYNELDEYFIRHNRPTGEEIRKLPLNSRGKRGDTDHKMLYSALSKIGRSEYYEDANLIGHVYWGWILPNVMKYRERIIDDYNKTQNAYHRIPKSERCRNSSLGTQYRLWRHLQLVGHPCYMEEFKIAENSDSLRTHNKLWKKMCELCEDPNIVYNKKLN